MAVRIRLTRVGRRKRPFYRIVAADQASPRDGRFLEILGTYDPFVSPSAVQVKQARLSYWTGKGATVSDTVRTLLRGIKLPPPPNNVSNPALAPVPEPAAEQI